MEHLIDFTQAQRLNSFGVIISAIKTFIQFVKTLGIAAIIILSQKSAYLFSIYFWLAILGILMIITFISYLSYRNFTYQIDAVNKEFIIKKGILNKERVAIKFDKILQININQNVIQQALELYSLQVESSGSKETEIDLYALDEKTAIGLKNYVLQLKGDLSENTDIRSTQIDDHQELIFELKARDILLVSLFSNYRQGMLLFLAFLITLYNQVSDFVFKDGIREYFENFNFSLFLSKILALFVFILFIPIIINLFRYFFTYYNFKLNRNRKGILNMQYGLFNLKDLIFNRDKVQLTIDTQNWLLKKFKLSIVTLQQVLTDQQKVENSLIHLPGISEENKQILYNILYDKQFGHCEIYTPSIRMFYSKIIKSFLFFGLLTIAGYLASDENLAIITCITGFLFTLTSIYYFIYYKNLKLYHYEDFIIKKAGVWDIKQTIIPLSKINAVSIGQTIWQIRNKLGYLDISTASGSIQFNFFEFALLNKLANITLYKVER